MTNLDDTRHRPMCEDAAKKILELEQRVKVLTDAGKDALGYLNLLTYDKDEDSESYSFFEARMNEDGFFIAKNTLERVLNQSPQQTAAQIERWHIEWMMKQPVVATKCDVREERFFFEDDIKRMQCLPADTKLVAIPPLPKESKE